MSETLPSAKGPPHAAPPPSGAGAIPRRGLWQIGLLTVLVVISRYNYLLFHALAEIYSIVIATGLFFIAWNARNHYRNNYLLFIGIAYLFVAGFDTLHMLGYHGMAVFSDLPGYNLGPQLWLVARALEAGALLIAPSFIPRPLRCRVVVSLLGLISGATLWSIFGAQTFPDCFFPESGLTAFKVVSEYVIIAILLAALLRLIRHRAALDRRVFRLLIAATALTVASELCFTLYISHYGPANLVGHLFKIVSFTLIYHAIIETALRRPFTLLFRDLKRRQDELLAAQRAAKLGSWSWRPNHPDMSWSEELYRLLDAARTAAPPSVDRFLAAILADDRKSLRQMLESARQGGAAGPIEVRRSNATGEIRYLRIEGGWGVDDEGEPLLAGVIQDVTEHVAAEQLREEINSITRHDLRTPLTPIIGIPEVMLLTGKNLTDEQRQMLEDIRHSGRKMLELLNCSLILYKIERGTHQLVPERFDLAGEILEILKGLASRTTSLRIVCRVGDGAGTAAPDQPLWIVGEKLLCYPLFANLLGNAIDASPPGETLTIALNETALSWRVDIDNAGEVPEAFRPRFFDKYATHGKKGGTGLGTYSAMMAARAHGGTIHLHSAAGRTTLTVELPKPADLTANAAP